MVQRRVLTSDFVNSVQPPPEGEVWIADIKIKGFGLRLFTSSRSGKSFSIRVSDESGRSIRKTFDLYGSPVYICATAEDRFRLELGDFLDDARSWAQTEIEKLKSSTLVEDENRRDRDEVGRLVRKITFQRAAESLIAGLYGRGRSQAYKTSLFSILKYIPDRLMRRALSEITPEEMAEALVDDRINPSNMTKLRSLIVQVFKQADDFGASSSEFLEQLSNHIKQRLKADYDPYSALDVLKRQDYERVLECLEKESTPWQQALCIRLYFEVGAPLSRVMSARWAQIYDGVWYPIMPSERKYWFLSREPLSGAATELIDRINTLVLRDFGETSFLFPSAHRGADAPIASIQPMWRRALSECGLPYYPLRCFALRFRRRKTPSYFRTTIDCLGLNSEENMADLSKVLI